MPGAQTAGVTRLGVLILGAGISGMGAAHRLTHQRPGTRFLVLESAETPGGAWPERLSPTPPRSRARPPPDRARA